MATLVDTEKCTGCGECVDSCPCEAIALEAEKACVNADECTDCGSCVDACPEEAITVED